MAHGWKRLYAERHLEWARAEMGFGSVARAERAPAAPAGVLGRMARRVFGKQQELRALMVQPQAGRAGGGVGLGRIVASEIEGPSPTARQAAG